MSNDDFEKALHDLIKDPEAKAVTLEAIGKFASKLGHDVNNILGTILGCVDLIKVKVNRQNPEANPFEKQFKLIETSIKRGTEITTKIRGFTRPGEIETQTLEIASVVESTIELFKGSGVTKADFEFIVKSNPKVNASHFYISQIISNLMANALEAMSKLPDRTLLVFVLEETIAKHAELPAGKYARISIVDHVVGVKDEHKQKLFEPFFSTKKTAVGEAMGLGLAMAHNIIQKLGGALEIESEHNLGTAVHILLPAVD